MTLFIQSRNFPSWVIKKSILLALCTVALVSTSYALNQRDQAARSFGHQMDAVQEDNGNNNQQDQGPQGQEQDQGQSNNGGPDNNNDQNNNQNDNNQNSNDNNGSQSNLPENNNNGNNNGQQEQAPQDQGQNNTGDSTSPNQADPSIAAKSPEINDLKEDVQSIMLRLDRIEGKLKLGGKEKPVHHKAVEKKKSKKKHKGS